MNRTKAIIRIAGMSLTASMILSAFGCAKIVSSNKSSYSEESLISTSPVTSRPEETVAPFATDPEPFYQAEEIPLVTHVDDEPSPCVLKWDSAPMFVGDYMIFEEQRFYDPVQDETGETVTSMDMERWLFLFDLSGKQLARIDHPKHGVEFNEINFCMTPDNELVMCYATASERGENTVHLCVYDLDGERKQDTTFLDPWAATIVGATVKDDGSFLVVTSSSVFHVDKEGVDVEQTDFPDGEICIDMLKEDGIYYAQMITMLGTGANYSSKITGLTPSDTTNGDRNAYNLVGMKVFQSANGVYAMTKNKLGRLSLKTGEFNQILDWNQTDIDRSRITQGDVKVVRDGTMAQAITLLDYTELGQYDPGIEFESDPTDQKRQDEGRQYAELYVSTTRKETNMEAVLLHFTKSDTNPSLGKKTIWVGGVDLADSGFSQFVVSYNARSESTAWIKLSDYSDFDSPYAFMKPLLMTKKEAVVSQLYKQMLSGVGPDMLFGFADSPIFDKNEILIDLNPYMDGIRGIDRMNYFNNVFEAFCTGDKLYQLPLSFSIQGVMRDESLYAQTEEDTLRNILALQKEAENEVLPCPAMPPNIIEELFISNTMSDGIDFANDKVEYSRNDILSLLALMNTMFESDYVYADDSNVYRWNYLYGAPEGYYNNMSSYFELADYEWGNVFFAPTEICNLEQYASAHVTHENVAMRGYPMPTSSGYTAKAYYSVGIAAYCSYKEEAWNFVSYLLSKDVQYKIAETCLNSNMASGTLPVNLEAFRNLGRYEIEIKKDWTHPGTAANGSWIDYDLHLDTETLRAFEDMAGQVTRRYLDDSDIHTIIQNHWYMINNDVESIEDASDSIIKEISDLLRSRG